MSDALVVLRDRLRKHELELACRGELVCPGFVYANHMGVRRLAVSIEQKGAVPVVIWRTADRELPVGAKAQGSATVTVFQRWAVRGAQATEADLVAFDEVERRREWRKRDAKAIKQVRRQIQRERA